MVPLSVDVFTFNDGGSREFISEVHLAYIIKSCLPYGANFTDCFSPFIDDILPVPGQVDEIPALKEKVSSLYCSMKLIDILLFSRQCFSCTHEENLFNFIKVIIGLMSWSVTIFQESAR